MISAPLPLLSKPCPAKYTAARSQEMPCTEDCPVSATQQSLTCPKGWDALHTVHDGDETQRVPAQHVHTGLLLQAGEAQGGH